MLHVLNGDATRVRLEPSGVPGDMTVWADVLHDGPAPDLPPGAFRAVRAAHLSGVVGESEGVIARSLEQRDMALERYRGHEEVVFWFEHDLFDQLILARHLHWLSTLDRGSVRFSLICVGEYPGIAPFNGLGQLSPTQLATLFPGRVPISDTQISIGRHAWNLFRAADPVPLSEWRASADTTALPFLEGALRRHLEDCPWLGDGLSRSERQILRTLGDRPYTAADLFAATQALEERVFMGDATFWSIVRGLARGPHPLVTIAPHERGMPIHGGLVELTNAGREVLAGGADQVLLNGIDRWMGGAHLTTEHHWRWGGVNVAFGAPRRNREHGT